MNLHNIMNDIITYSIRVSRFEIWISEFHHSHMSVFSVYLSLQFHIHPVLGCGPCPALVPRWNDPWSVGASPGSDQASKNQTTLFSSIEEISKVNSIRTVTNFDLSHKAEKRCRAVVNWSNIRFEWNIPDSAIRAILCHGREENNGKWKVSKKESERATYSLHDFTPFLPSHSILRYYDTI